MPTLLEYRLATMKVLNDGGMWPAIASTSDTVRLGLSINLTPNASVHRYDGRWLYIASGTAIGQQRVVQTGGYNPLIGQYTVWPSWSTSPAVYDDVLLTGIFPSISNPGSPLDTAPLTDTSYRDLINRALRHLVVPDRLTLPITTADTYSLATYAAWLDRPERLVRVREPSPVSGRDPIDASWRGPELVLDAGAPLLKLHAPFGTASGDLTLEVLRPAHTLISGVETTAGLDAEDDTAIPDVESVVTATLVEAYQVLMNRTPGRPTNQWAGLYDEALASAQRLRYYDASLQRPQAPAAPQEAA